MKIQLIIPFSIAVSFASFALMKTRVKELARDEKKAKFTEVKLRVTEDMLMEYSKDKQDLQTNMDKEKAAQEQLQKTLTDLSNDALKAELNTCQGLKKTATVENKAVQAALKTFQAESTKEKADWEAEIKALSDKLNTTSPICKYLKAGSSLPGICPEKKEEPKAEPPKPAEEKKEPPKPEEPKAEPPKPEEAKAEPPKPEEAKAEPPKPEEAKAEPPKPEEEKKEPPKAEEKKPDEPPKGDAPK